jgi:acyl-CoA thioesterase YciA
MAENKNDQPNGELTIRTLAMPKDTNPHGDIFGGWVLSQMDIAGGIYTRKQTGQKTVTVAVDAMEFLLPVLVGDVICCYCQTVKVGKTSVTVDVDVYVSRQFEHERIKVTEGRFTYVAVDSTRRPIKIRRQASMEGDS